MITSNSSGYGPGAGIFTAAGHIREGGECATFPENIQVKMDFYINLLCNISISTVFTGGARLWFDIIHTRM